MGGAACHADVESVRQRARTVLLKTLGAKRVADWCSVSEATVYQWISRGTEDRPIPPERIADISRGAAAAGLKFDLRDLWPGMPA